MGVEWAIAFMSVTLAVAFGYFCHFYLIHIKAESATKNAKIIRANAERDAQVTLREAEIKARDTILKVREDFESEAKLLRQEIQLRQDRLHHREETIDRKLGGLEDRERQLDQRLVDIESLRSDIAARDAEINELVSEQRRQLSEIAGLTKEDAKRQFLAQLSEDLEAESNTLIRHRQEEARDRAEVEARKIITTAIQRYAADQVNQISTDTVHLPSEAMKGRIIGKEGRNIRSLEQELGVDILIDDTPEVVVVSAFDPMRREIAKQTLERLVADGRIHPAYIESTSRKVRSEMDETIWNAGDEAVAGLGLRGVSDEIIRILGRLKFRTSYAQNVLKHSIEVAHLMANMAGELHLDPALARRVGLLHDIGKAVDHEKEGTHALLGAELLKKNGEDPLVVNAVAAHHGEVEQQSLYATLICAADAITAARPGARAENTQIYIKRLHDLEAIANRQSGVINSYAIQAGRELRVIVEPEQLTEDQALQLARTISQAIEEQVTYPGEVKVTVVRETRCVEFAR